MRPLRWWTPLYCADGCAHCGQTEELNVIATFRHDLGCWGWATAWANLWRRDPADDGDE